MVNRNRSDSPMIRNTVDMSLFHHLYPFESRFQKISGFRYHYLDEGSGDPMVMIHGNPTWSFYYRNLIRAFSKDYRVIAPDHIGCGLSDKPPASAYPYRFDNRVGDLITLLDGLNIRKNITLVVHDWGGAVGMAYAVRHPDRIRALIVLNTAAFFPPSGKKIPLRLSVIRNLKPVAAAVLKFNLFALGAAVMAPVKKLAKDVRAGLIAPYNSPDNRIATLRFVQDIPLTPSDPSYNSVRFADENLYRLTHIPMLICWGKHDFVFDDAYFSEWKKRFPRAKAYLFEDAGHYILEDAPDKVISAMKLFLQNIG